MEDDNRSKKNGPAGDRPDDQGKSPGIAADSTGSVSSKQILVPLDGSPLAEMALPPAVALARATSSGLLLMRMVPPMTLIEPMGGLLEASPEVWELYEQQPELAKQYLQEVIERLRPTGLDIDTWITEGEPAESIIRYTQEHPEIVAIAMSTHGRSGLGRWLFGSVAEKVLHSSPVPLLLIRPEAEPEYVDLAAVPRFKTLLVPLDSSPFAEQALDYAQEFAQAVDGRLVLISVTSTPFDLKLVKPEVNAEWSAVPWGTPAELLVKYLDGIGEKLAATSVPVQARVTYGDAADEILKAAKYEGADIIVMATHGRSGLGHLLIGSTAGRVAQAATIPLLLVRAKMQPGDEQHAK